LFHCKTNIGIPQRYLILSPEISIRYDASCGRIAKLPYNRIMSTLEILIPFSLPPAEMAPDLLRTLATPALATLLSRAQASAPQESDAFSRSLPHETWLARKLGLASPAASNSSPQLAIAAMQTIDYTDEGGYWFLVQPVHIHIARDHLVLTDQRRLDLLEQESRALFATAKSVFAESGKTLLYGDAQTWFMRADDWADMQTSTPDAACGHNIDIWMPKDPSDQHDRAWRKLQNEVQMHWHTHVVNEQREFRRADPINSIWLWGGAGSAQPGDSTRFTHSFGLPKAYGHFASNQMQSATVNDVLAAKPQHGLVMLDRLISAGLAQDWSYWLEQMHALEAEWFAPLLGALKAGQLGNVSMILSHNTKLMEFKVTRNSLRKFWVKRSLAALS
jgi:hypothetical protein